MSDNCINCYKGIFDGFQLCFVFRFFTDWVRGSNYLINTKKKKKKLSSSFLIDIGFDEFKKKMTISELKVIFFYCDVQIIKSNNNPNVSKSLKVPKRRQTSLVTRTHY